jgi:hypothetical protein
MSSKVPGTAETSSAGVVEGMAQDIHQDRFALMAVLTRAHVARPHDYVDRESLMSMSDERLVAYALELLRSLEETPADDDTTVEVRTALREILDQSG